MFGDGHMRLPELIPVGGLFTVQVPAVEQGHPGVLYMKLADDKLIEIADWRGKPVYKIVSGDMATYPITGYYGTLEEMWDAMEAGKDCCGQCDSSTS